MSYDDHLAARIADLLAHHPAVTSKRMFGSLAWLLHGNMFAGVYQDNLILRLGSPRAEDLQKQEYFRPMDLTGKPMKGWLIAQAEAIEADEDLQHYVRLAMEFTGGLPVKG